MKLSKLGAVAMACAITLLGAPAMAEGGMVSLEGVPEAAQQTIQQHVGGGEITKLERKSKDGQGFYEATVRQPDGTKLKLKVSEDGKLMSLDRKD